MTYEPNVEGLNELGSQIGDRVREVVNETARETAEQDLDAAVDLMHVQLNGIQGLSLGREWSQNALVTLRRGDDFEIRLQ